MKKNIVIHPFLFALYPALELFYTLSPGVIFRDTWRMLFFLLALTALLFISMGLWLRDWARGGFYVTLVLFGLVYYGGIRLSIWQSRLGGGVLGRHEILFPLWLLLLIGMGSIWHCLRQPNVVTVLFNVMSVMAILLSGARYVQKTASQRMSYAEMVNVKDNSEASLQLVYTYRPDI